MFPIPPPLGDGDLDVGIHAATLREPCSNWGQTKTAYFYHPVVPSADVLELATLRGVFVAEICEADC